MRSFESILAALKTRKGAAEAVLLAIKMKGDPYIWQLTLEHLARALRFGLDADLAWSLSTRSPAKDPEAVELSEALAKRYVHHD
jgi:hypothetical protein